MSILKGTVEIAIGEELIDHVRIEGLLFTGAPVIEDGAVNLDRSTSGNGLALRDDVDQYRTPVTRG